MNQVTQITDAAIINMLDMDFTHKVGTHNIGGRIAEEISDIVPPVFPEKSLLLTDIEERGHSPSREYSPYSIRKIIGDKIELLSDSSFDNDKYTANWVCMEKVGKKFGLRDNQFVVPVAPPYTNYIFHHRHISTETKYYSTIPLTLKNDEFHPALNKSSIARNGMCNVIPNETLFFINSKINLICSVAEDFLRINSFSVELKNIETAHTITFNVSANRLSELLYIRDNPLTITGRKRPIIHWVANHLRNTKHKSDIKVIKHLRGITKFTMDGFNVTVTPNTGEELKGLLR